MIWIDFYGSLYTPTDIPTYILRTSIHFHPSLGQKWRLKVNNSDSKSFWSTLLVYCISLMTSLWISVHSGTSLGMWTFISGPKMTENRDYWSKWRLQVHDLDFKWFCSNLLMYCIFLMTFLWISVHAGPSVDIMWTFISGPKMTEIVIWVKNGGSRSWFGF